MNNMDYTPEELDALYHRVDCYFDFGLDMPEEIKAEVEPQLYIDTTELSAYCLIGAIVLAGLLATACWIYT